MPLRLPVPAPALLCLAWILGVGCADVAPGGADPASGPDDRIGATERPDPATSGTLVGRVDGPEGGLPAVVRLGDREVQADARGRFRLDGVPAGPVSLKASLEGWTGGDADVVVAAAAWTATRLVLVPVSEATLPDPPAGGAVVSEDGVEVVFDAGGSFTTESGEPVTGPVQVSIALVNTPGALLAAPPLVAVGPDGLDVALESFGMAEVVLTAGGAPVTFAGTATLSIPLSASGLTSFPDGAAIGLWSFDPALGRWVDEGSGVVAAGAFVATVTHFTWWNADLPLTESACITGKLELARGTPAAGYAVQALGVDYLGVSTASTSAQGDFCVAVKRGAVARISAAGSSPRGGSWSWTQVVASGAAPSACGGVCTHVGTATVQSAWFDADGDGWTPAGGDCDDADPTIHPGSPDPPGDGVDQNCDGPDGIDADGDGSLAPASGGADCDDGDPTVYPGAPERCDGVDEDCDGTIDEDAIGAPLHHADADGDGYGDPSVTTSACAPPPGTVANGDDCDDAAAAVHPGAPESCDGADEDCDGAVDEAGAVGETPWHADADGDGYGDPDLWLLACGPPAGWIADATDCDDTLAAVNPVAAEACNGLDDDCDGGVDPPGATGSVPFYADGDGDGWAPLGAASVSACAAPPGFASALGDCDDADPAVSPGALETCADATDLNCDGSVQFADADGDGTAACLDCDDADPTRYPGAPEACDAVDSDCDGDLVDYFADTDSDAIPDCVDPDDDGDGTLDVVDCDPGDPSIYLGAPELCDGIDSDCDGDLVDGAADEDGDGDPDCNDPDDDGDGSPDTLDCAPLDPATYPGAPELCDGVDNDCDGAVDSCALVSADAEIYGDGIGHELGAALGLGDLDGDGVGDLVVASPASGAAAPWAGAVYVFAGPQAGVVPLSAATGALTGEAAEDWAGTSVATGCDFDGDGIEDLGVGAWGHDGGGAAAGRVYVVSGPITGTSSLALADGIRDGESAGDWAGWSVACAGDTDGDGFDDLIVGAWRDDTTSTDAGAAYLLRGPILGSGTLATADAKLLGVAHHDYAGFAVAGAGDVNGDGFDDLLVGAEGADDGGPTSGAVYLVYGPVAGTVPLGLGGATFVGANPGDRLGSAVAGAGDVNGDGVDDVVLGAWASPGDGTEAGAAFVFFGGVGASAPSGTLSAGAADVTVPGAAPGDELGRWVARGGDPNGDGTGDLLLGAPGSDAGEPGGGAAYLLDGPLVGPVRAVSTALGTYLGGFPADEAGAAVVGGLDVDGDGIDDVLIGAPANDATGANAGAAYLQSAGGLP